MNYLICACLAVLGSAIASAQPGRVAVVATADPAAIGTSAKNHVQDFLNRITIAVNEKNADKIMQGEYGACETIKAYLDTPFITRAVMPNEKNGDSLYNSASEDQKKRYYNAASSLLTIQLVTTLKQLHLNPMQVQLQIKSAGLAKASDGREVPVATIQTTIQGTNAEIRLVQSAEGSLKIRDLVADGVSYLITNKKQFAGLGSSGIEGVIARIETQVSRVYGMCK